MRRCDLLDEIARRALTQLYDPETELFRAKLLPTPEGIQAVGHSLRYSAMAAIGLVAAAQRGEPETSLPLETILERMAETALAGSDTLDLALTLWAHARADTPRVPALLADVERSYERLAGWYTCMGLSWSLAAVEHVARLGGELESRARAGRPHGARAAAISAPGDGLVRDAALAPVALDGDRD